MNGIAFTATSISPTEGSVTHGPELVLDQRPETAWNTNLSGVDQSITLKLDYEASIRGLRIMNGYNKISSKRVDLYDANCRAKEILVTYEGNKDGTLFTLKDKECKGKYQKIEFGKTVNTSWITITIKSVYRDQYTLYDDCCISEIEVF